MAAKTFYDNDKLSAAELNALGQDTDWITTIPTAGSGWSINFFRVRTVGAFGAVFIEATKTGSALTVSAGSGNITNSALTDVNAVPVAMRAVYNVPLHSGEAGRVATGVMRASDGRIDLAAVAGNGTNIAVGDVVQLYGTWLKG